MSLGEYFIVVGYKIVGWDMECGCSDRSGCLGFCWKTRSGFALIPNLCSNNNRICISK